MKKAKRIKRILKDTIKAFLCAFVTMFCASFAIDGVSWLVVAIAALGTALLSMLTDVCGEYMEDKKNAKL